MMATILAAGTTASAEQNALISRPDFKVEDGKFTPELIEAFGRASDPQLSPDKKKILYNLEFINLEADKGNKELWVMDIDGKNAVQLTFTNDPEVNAVWFNEGKQIAFLSKAENGMLKKDFPASHSLLTKRRFYSSAMSNMEKRLRKYTRNSTRLTYTSLTI